jgi:cytochrome P450
MTQSFFLSALEATTLSHVVIVVLLASLVWSLYSFTLHPLARFPGPLSVRLGIPGWWPLWQTYNFRYAWSLEALHDRYGSAVRIDVNHVSFNTAEAAQVIYAHGAGSTFPKTTFYQSFQVYPTQPSLFSEIHSDRHAAFRRAISSAYSMNNLVKLEEFVEPLLSKLHDRLDSKSGGVVDLAKWLHFFAMDAVGELAFGNSFGFVDKGSDDKRFLQGVSNLSHWGSMAGWTPRISRTLRKLLKRTSGGQPGGEVVGQATEPLISRRYDLLDKKKKQSSLNEKDTIDVLALDERQDMLANFVQSKNPNTGKPLTKTEVLRTAISVVSAGSDTTATALTTFIGYVIRDKKVYDRLQQEIDQAFETGTLTWPVKYGQAVKLDYLQACIKEVLRMHPPIGMSLPRIVNSKQGMALDGKTVVPYGSQVSVAPYVMHRNIKVFGTDARIFNPDRWIDLDEAERKTMEKNNLTFGGGARQCIGKNISLMEINKALPTLLRAFHFDISTKNASWCGVDSDGHKDKQVPWRCRSTWFLEVQEFPVRVSRRENVEH